MPKRNYYIHTIMFILLMSVITLAIPFTAHAESETGKDKLVYVVPVQNEVERGLEAFLKRVTTEAAEEGANHIIFEIDTPGGRVDAAGQIANVMQSLEIPSTSFVINEALSAGSYIALNTDKIFMKPHATMGASGVINQDGTAADKKAQSAWIAAMKSAAESKGKDPIFAAAMADASIDLPDYGAPKGEYLTLGPKQAVEVDYAEAIVDNRTELLHKLDLSDATVVETDTTIAEEAARFLTNPVVIPILLSIASLGLIVELYSPGFGVPGAMGILALVLFFYGHIIAGLAGMEAVILLILGIILIILEFFVSGGILGIVGIGCIVASLFMSGASLGHMSMSVAIALIVAIVVAIILFKWIGLERGIFKHIILKDRTMTEDGYVSSENKLELIGLEGETITPLRPSGKAVINEDWIDVVSEGGFVEAGKKIKVTKVEGVRVVVREE